MENIFSAIHTTHFKNELLSEFCTFLAIFIYLFIYLFILIISSFLLIKIRKKIISYIFIITQFFLLNQNVLPYLWLHLYLYATNEFHNEFSLTGTIATSLKLNTYWYKSWQPLHPLTEIYNLSQERTSNNK